MPKLKKVIAGLALSTALGGGALAVGATAASASTTPTGWGWSNPSNEFDAGFNNTFENSAFHTAPFLTDSFGSGCSRGCSSADLDDILWDVCVAGHCGGAFPASFG
ncbi:hypothetical protein OHB01_06045 [Microbispora hainanensis]|uniref:Secreted protein n=1 Tax=Microbispora hainanensis TaxID=568844 RepID=A0ABZ1SPI2_9ACTN|nr:MULTISPECIES: hypothetical protein [Microbispora]NJP29196.1 hypothetical protein [Microbispora sp. CL1-1]TQS06015.1 hypothetical protein FLW53_34355 [Microbispora sp. SCL1-1]